MFAFLLAAALASPLPTNVPICAQYFPASCNEAVGQWLPSFGLPMDFWAGATHVTRTDSFSSDPKSGTAVVFTINMQKANVAYDRAQRIALYTTGCCSWSEDVVGYSSPPPKPVANIDLSKLHTARGVRLGMSQADVMGIYGTTKAQRVPRHGRVLVLAYTTCPAQNNQSSAKNENGQFQNFFFRDGRLIQIQLGNGC